MIRNCRIAANFSIFVKLCFVFFFLLLSVVVFCAGKRIWKRKQQKKENGPSFVPNFRISNKWQQISELIKIIENNEDKEWCFGVGFSSNMLCSICLRMRLFILDKQWSDAKLSKYHNAEKSDFFYFLCVSRGCKACISMWNKFYRWCKRWRIQFFLIWNHWKVKKKNNPNWRNVRSLLFHTIKSIGGIFLTLNHSQRI